MPGLKEKAIHGLFWSLLERAGSSGIRFAIGIILARLLSPVEFGLVAMMLIFVAIGELLISSGFSFALIQKKELSKTDTSSVFYLNLVVGLASALLLFLAAPLISSFYGQPVLVPLARIMSLNLFLASLQAVPIALFIRDVKMKRILVVNMVSVLVSGGVGITLALNGWGVWSLAIQQVLANLLSVILVWSLSSWRPTRDFNLLSLKTMFKFGKNLMLSGFLNLVFTHVYFVIIGKTTSTYQLGLYSRSKQMSQFVGQAVMNGVVRVFFPVFSSLQDDRPGLKRAVKRAMAGSCMVSFPVMLGLALVAKPMVTTLLTEKWLPCVPYLQLMCVIGALQPVQSVHLNVLTALGRSDLFLRLEIIKVCLVTVVLLITFRSGITAIIYGQIVVCFIAYFINSYYTVKMLGYTWPEQARDVLPYFVMTVLMGAAVFAVQGNWFSHELILLVVQGMTGAVVYVTLCRVFRLVAFMDVWCALLAAVRKRRASPSV